MSVSHAQGRPTPVVFAGEHGALPIIRSLGFAGISSAVVSADPDEITFRSRFCNRRVAIESLTAAHDASNLQILHDLALSLRCRPVLYWGSDAEVLFINRNREALSEWYRYILPAQQLTHALINKDEFESLAEKEDLPVPLTRKFFSYEELAASADTLPFPCTLKPIRQDLWDDDYIKTTYGNYKAALRRLKSRDELLVYARKLPNIDKGFVVQEFVEGRDENVCSYHAFFDETGRLIGSFVGRKIRTSPIHFGGSTYVETAHVPELLELGASICRKISLTGIVKIDFKQDSRSGKYKILEFNPRFNLWEYVGAFAGINLPLMWYQHLTGDPLIHSDGYKAGRRWLYMAQDLRVLKSYMRLGEWTFFSYVRSLFAPKVYHTFAWSDPMPLLHAFPRFVARKLARLRLVRRVHRAGVSKP